MSLVLGLLMLWGVFELGGWLGAKKGHAQGLRDGRDAAVKQMGSW